MNTKTLLLERFWSKADVGSYDVCWNWLAGKNKSGYGEFYFPYRNKKHTRAHQVSWILSYGDIPEGMCVCHKCDNPSCINPNHLFLGTMKDNIVDRDTKGRRKSRFLYGEDHPQHGSNSKFHKLTEDNVRVIRKMLDEKLTLREIAALFDVSPGLINNIKHGRKWAWLKD